MTTKIDVSFEAWKKIADHYNIPYEDSTIGFINMKRELIAILRHNLLKCHGKHIEQKKKPTSV